MNGESIICKLSINWFILIIYLLVLVTQFPCMYIVQVQFFILIFLWYWNICKLEENQADK